MLDFVLVWVRCDGVARVGGVKNVDKMAVSGWCVDMVGRLVWIWWGGWCGYGGAVGVDMVVNGWCVDMVGRLVCGYGG